MQAIILAGGEGKRLKPLTDSMPKPLIKVAGKPLLDRLIEHCRRNGVDEVIVCAGYMAEKIKGHVEMHDYGIKVEVAVEEKPLGTAGALLPIKERLQDEFIVLYGDVYAEADLKKMMEFHLGTKADATLLLHESSHPWDSTVVKVEGDMIVKFAEKPGEVWEKFGKLTSAALYVLKKGALDYVREGDDFARDVFPRMLAAGRKLAGYVSEEYVKDMGTMERLKEVEAHLSGSVAAFIDRDGVINEEIGFLTKKEQLRLIKGAAEGIRMLNDAGILAVVVTNQPVVARNMVTEEKLREIHDHLIEMLQKEGARIDAVYYCPHHPEKNHPEANDPRYRKECECRKPKTGMVDEATKTFKIDAGSSYVVGDRTVDVQLGKNAGCTTILVKTGHGGRDGKFEAKADYEVGSLLEACKLIIQLEGEKKK